MDDQLFCRFNLFLFERNLWIEVSLWYWRILIRSRCQHDDRV